jgi:hypothetical protein
MDIKRIKNITIVYADFIDLISGKTNNPIAESEIPEMLRDAIKAGVDVVLTDEAGQNLCRLIMNKDGEFQYVSLSLGVKI